MTQQKFNDFISFAGRNFREENRNYHSYIRDLIVKEALDKGGLTRSHEAAKKMFRGYQAWNALAMHDSQDRFNKFIVQWAEHSNYPIAGFRSLLIGRAQNNLEIYDLYNRWLAKMRRAGK